ncbi:YtxH domain-containing protein [Humidesulfovibrio sp.]
MSNHTYGYSLSGATIYQNPAQAQYAQQTYMQQPYAQAQYAQQRDPARTKPASAPASKAALGSWFNVTDPAYVKGLLLGAGVALVLTNPTVQKALVGGAVRVWAAVQGGVEEIKEQIEDVKAELSREG